MPINSAYRVNSFFTSSTFWEFVSARIMKSNFTTANYIADWKEKTELIKLDYSQKLFPKKVSKNSRYLKAS